MVAGCLVGRLACPPARLTPSPPCHTMSVDQDLHPHTGERRGAATGAAQRPARVHATHYQANTRCIVGWSDTPMLPISGFKNPQAIARGYLSISYKNIRKEYLQRYPNVSLRMDGCRYIKHICGYQRISAGI